MRPQTDGLDYITVDGLDKNLIFYDALYMILVHVYDGLYMMILLYVYDALYMILIRVYDAFIYAYDALTSY